MTPLLKTCCSDITQIFRSISTTGFILPIRPAHLLLTQIATNVPVMIFLLGAELYSTFNFEISICCHTMFTQIKTTNFLFFINPDTQGHFQDIKNGKSG